MWKRDESRIYTPTLMLVGVEIIDTVEAISNIVNVKQMHLLGECAWSRAMKTTDGKVKWNSGWQRCYANVSVVDH